MYTYVARIVDKIDNGPRKINSIKVGVFRIEDEHEEQVGEYIRNYSALFHTFFPFKSNEKDYALYSPNCTATRIMELPSGKDIGGEEPDSWGFCPVDYYVPSYIEREMEWADNKGENHITRHRVSEPKPDSLLRHVDKHARAQQQKRTDNKEEE